MYYWKKHYNSMQVCYKENHHISMYGPHILKHLYNYIKCASCLLTTTRWVACFLYPTVYTHSTIYNMDAGTWLYHKAVMIITSTQWHTGGTWKLCRVHVHMIISNWRADNQSNLTHHQCPWSQKKCKMCFRRNRKFLVFCIFVLFGQLLTFHLG